MGTVNQLTASTAPTTLAEQAKGLMAGGLIGFSTGVGAALAKPLAQVAAANSQNVLADLGQQIMLNGMGVVGGLTVGVYAVKKLMGMEPGKVGGERNINHGFMIGMVACMGIGYSLVDQFNPSSTTAPAKAALLEAAPVQKQSVKALSL